MELKDLIILGLEILILLAILFVRWKKVDFSGLTNQIKDFGKTIRYLRIAVLRLELFDDKLDVYSRMEAGLNYLKLGGNGKGKNKTMELAAENPDAWDTVMRNTDTIDEDPDYFSNSVKDINKLIEYKQRQLRG